MIPKIGGSLIIPPYSNIKDLELEIRNFKSAGYDYAELQTKSIDNFQDELKIIRNIIPLYSYHLPQIDYKKAGIEICKNYIEFLSDQGIYLFIIHLYSQNLPTKENLEFKINSLNDLADYAENEDSIKNKKLQINILIC